MTLRGEVDKHTHFFEVVGSIVNQKLNAGLDYRTVLSDIFEVIDPFVPFDRLGIAFLEDNNEYVRLNWAKSKMLGSNLTAGYRARLKGSSLAQIAETGLPRIINDLASYLVEHPESESTRAILKDGVRSSLTFPLRADGQVVGFVFFSSSKPQTYDSSHAELLSKVAEEISLLVRFGQLHNFFANSKEDEGAMRTALHELRSPLAIIQGYLDLMDGEEWHDGLNGEKKQFFEILRRNVQAMFSLISDLSEVNRANDVREKLEATKVDLRNFFDEAVSGGSVLASAKSISFSASFDSNLPEIWIFDAGKINQVLNNLFTNAVKFSNPGSKIFFSLSLEKDFLIFCVQDTGPGIPSNEVEKLFKEFGKTSVKPTAGESSTGLGLSISKKIVEAHSGEIYLQTKVGVGSTFRFKLPLQSSVSYKQ